MIFDINRAKKKNVPPCKIEMMEKANRNSEVLKTCDLHEFELKDIKKAIKSAGPAAWTNAKCKCKKCGGEVFALYAGGYMDAVRQLEKLNKEGREEPK